MNKTITYIINAKEEGAVNSLARVANIQGEDIADLFNSTEKFLSLKMYYLESDPQYAKPAGFGPEKTRNLTAINKRIMENKFPTPETGYYPKLLYSTAISRYNSLLDRNYEKTLFEHFNENVYFTFRQAWKKSCDKATFNLNLSEIKETLLETQYSPTNEWLARPISHDTLARIKSLYSKMLEVRFRNMIFETWSELVSSQLKSMQKHYHGTLCELPLGEFMAFYGRNDKTTRKCEYCGISESDIEKLDLKQQIFTKRYYSRGSTMEVDKRDPSKNYETTNLVMSCYWCNNAKTDEFTESEFLTIAKGIRTVWENRLKGAKD